MSSQFSHLNIVKPTDKPSTDAEKAVGVTTDIIEVTPDQLRSWLLPPCQRELNINANVRALGVQIREDDGVIPGPMTLARLAGHTYIIDGQHRRASALLSECVLLYVEVRWVHVRHLGDVDKIFKDLQKQLVRMRPDDNLRASEGANPGLMKIRSSCPFVGYDKVRRSGNGPMLSMSTLLRGWFAAVPETPSATSLSPDTLDATVKADSQGDVAHIIVFANACYAAWGREAENKRLWTGLNLTLCAWLYQRTVMKQYSGKSSRLTKEMFQRCLMSVAADATYNSWLVDRTLRERDRSPAYAKLKAIFAKRITLEAGKKPMLPQPTWAH
jgi:hypothetical protein